MWPDKLSDERVCEREGVRAGASRSQDQQRDRAAHTPNRRLRAVRDGVHLADVTELV